MIKGTVLAHYIDGTTRELPGYLIAPGLAVHRAVTMTGADTSDWIVAHVDSGFRVCGSFPTRKQAVAAAEGFAKLANWAQPWQAEEFKRTRLLEGIQRIRDRILYEGPAFKPVEPLHAQGRLFE